MTRNFPWKVASPVPCTRLPGNASATIFSIRAASSTWEGVPLPRRQPEQRRQCHRGRAARQLHHPSTVQVLPKPIFFRPARRRHKATGPRVAAPSAEEGSVYRHGDRISIAEQVLHDQPATARPSASEVEVSYLVFDDEGHGFTNHDIRANSTDLEFLFAHLLKRRDAKAQV
jgi:hypothetical protein